MVVNDFDSIGAVLGPHEADSPLVVDAYAVLPFSVIFQWFEPIGWRYLQVNQRLRLIQHEKFAQGNLLDIARQLARHFAAPDFLRFLGCESDDHAPA